MQLNIKNQFVYVIEMDLIELIIGNFLGFGFALLLYSINQWRLHIKENIKEMERQIHFLSLISEEIYYNLLLTQGFAKIDFNKDIPLGRLRFENQKGCWSRVVEYRHKNISLINSINLLYLMFETLNKCLDFIPSYFSDTKDTTSHIKNLELRFKELAIKTINEGNEVLKIIEKELNQ